jgi:hypothetical protein
MKIMEVHTLTKKRIPELKIEPVDNRVNLMYTSLLEYKRELYLCVIDNITPTEIGAYVLDYAEQENVPVADFLSVVTRWFYSKSDTHPLSVELARQGLTERLTPIYRSFDTTYVARIIGKGFAFDALSKSKVRRRRVVAIPEGIEIHLRKAA